MVDLFKIEESCKFIKSFYKYDIDTAVVLGTGLDTLSALLIENVSIDYASIPHFPTSTVDSHSGRLILGKIGKKHVVIMAGRFHFYEGYEMSQVTYYVHVLNALAVNRIIFTNASGGLNPHFKLGDIVMLSDHINLFPFNPLRGSNYENLGPRFPDMVHVYDQGIRESAKMMALKLGINLKEGVYLGWQGPSLETPAEYRMARILGADLIGMSTVPEVIVARYYGIRVGVFSVVSNVCFPTSLLIETTIEEIIHAVKKTSESLSLLLNEIMIEI